MVKTNSTPSPQTADTHAKKPKNSTNHPAVIPQNGFMRLPQVLAVIPIGKSSWWQGVAEGRYPAPVKLSPRTTAWKASDIRALIERLGGEVAA